MRLILASTSPYRRELLARLHLPFEAVAPEFPEASPGTMPPAELVRHNTLGKLGAVAGLHPEATVIAADQLAVCGNLVLGKPVSKEQACEQLGMLSGQCVEFFTGLALQEPGRQLYELVPFRVHFRKLARQEIENYVDIERPLDCAGSFKSEGLGISLFERLEGDDPTALIGLPLIRLSQWLRPLDKR